jgi:hypothetical protein
MHSLLARSIVVALTALASEAATSTPVQPGARAAAEDSVIFESRTGEVTRRSAESLGNVDLATAGAAFVRFEHVDPVTPLVPKIEPLELATLDLAGGDRVLGRLRSGAGERVELELEAGPVLALDVDKIAQIVFEARLSTDQRASLRSPAQGDLLYTLRDGALDRVEGTLQEFKPEGVRFESPALKKTVTCPWNEVAALFIEALGAKGGSARKEPPANAAGVPVAVDLTDGGRLRGRCLALSSAGCRLAYAGAELVLPLSALDELFVDDGGLAFLSDRKPARAVEGSPFGDELGLTWPHRVDASVTGSPLTVGGRKYRRGLGVHAPSRLTWTLDGAYRELRGSVGVDDQVLLLPHHGAVNFRIFGDEKLLWESGTLRGGENARAFTGLSLAGVKELTLEAAADAESFVADRADWLRVLLVRGS